VRTEFKLGFFALVGNENKQMITKLAAVAKLLLLSLILFISILSGSVPAPTLATAQPTQTVNRFSSEAGRFSVALPPNYPDFQQTKQTQQTATGNVELHIFNSETRRGACVIGYSDFSPAAFEGKTPQKMLEGGRVGALENIKGTLEKEESTTVQRYPGLIVYAAASLEGKPIYFRFIFVLARPRVYQIGFLTFDRAFLDGPEVQAYFKSFRIEE
jgi:hypothetical protein